MERAEASTQRSQSRNAENRRHDQGIGSNIQMHRRRGRRAGTRRTADMTRGLGGTRRSINAEVAEPKRGEPHTRPGDRQKHPEASTQRSQSRNAENRRGLAKTPRSIDAEAAEPERREPQTRAGDWLERAEASTQRSQSRNAENRRHDQGIGSNTQKHPPRRLQSGNAEEPQRRPGDWVERAEASTAETAGQEHLESLTAENAESIKGRVR